MKKLKQEILKEFFTYDHVTGVFIRIKSASNRSKVGVEANNTNPKGYIFLCINKGKYLAHRMAWLYVYGRMPLNYIDHINGNKLDNRILNLRDVASTENNRNRTINKNNSSGVNGVSWCKSTESWLVTICNDSKMNYIGRFKSKDDAIKKRKDTEKEYGYHENHGRNR